MKTRNLVSTLIIMIMTGISLNAGTGNETVKRNASYEQLQKQISEKLVYPQFALQQMGAKEVNISFTVDEGLRLQILDIISPDKRLCMYVRKMLNNKLVNADSTLINKHFTLNIRFQS